MNKIELQKDVVYTLVDSEDYKKFSPQKWSYAGGYAVRYTADKKRIYLHREIMKCPSEMFVDHINNNRLDNRRENLRICTHAENVRNVGLRSNNVTGYIGVSYIEERKSRQWRARTRKDGVTQHIGYYETPEDAAKAYDTFVVSISEFSKTNFGLGLL